MLVSGTNSCPVVKVSDFDDDLYVPSTTLTGMQTTNHAFKGMTLAYTAPEICSREVKQPTLKSDI